MNNLTTAFNEKSYKRWLTRNYNYDGSPKTPHIPEVDLNLLSEPSTKEKVEMEKCMTGCGFEIPRDRVREEFRGRFKCRECRNK